MHLHAIYIAYSEDLFLPGDGHVFRNLSEAIVSGKLPLDSVMYQDIANTADNIKESWTTRFRTREPLRAWFLAMNDEQSGARAIEGMRGPMGFRRKNLGPVTGTMCTSSG
jgi:hypothetical protein